MSDSERLAESKTSVHAVVNAAEVEYVMRSLLPKAGSFHSGPSGDTAYDEAYRQSIFENLPPGFEVAWKSRGHWPVDKDGVTWVKIYRSTRRRQAAILD